MYWGLMVGTILGMLLMTLIMLYMMGTFDPPQSWPVLHGYHA